MEPQKLLSLLVRVNLGVMGMKRYCTFSKPPVTEPHNQFSLVSYPGCSLGGSYPSVEMQLAYSTVQADWAVRIVDSYFLPGVVYVGDLCFREWFLYA